jgi:(1->4)-alpha-D-glucan 1-alpha-D-glucosylmutase
MRLPSATYRLQFRNGMDFDRAAALVPYLDALGISHLYASPIFTASTGSTHGYDITDPTEIDPTLGGREGLERLSAALRARDMGLILDIVPNHMAFAPETPWLRDVLRHGRASRHARHFDIDLDSERLRLPWLPDHFERLIDTCRAEVQDDPDGPVLVLGDLRVPLADTPHLGTARADPSPDAIRRLHAEQPWRLVDWRTEQDALTHRRFFNVTGLVGVRVEDPQVFEDSHALLLDLVAAGTVDGLRIDHVDGLVDPAGYLSMLRARAPGIPIWIEKILSDAEELPPWPVEGTTGYEVSRLIGRLVLHPEGREEIASAYREATGREAPVAEVFARAKRQIIGEDLAAELWSLHGMLREIAGEDPIGVEFGPEALRHAIVELVAAFTRYRTYMTASGISDEDRRVIGDAAEAAQAASRTPGAIPFLAEVLLRPGSGPDALRLRFQQVTGAVIAKAQEDTAFYREVPLLSANEVGGEPDDSPVDPPVFHAEMTARARQWPRAMTLTSSHDTKRSEDARMRIAAITHDPRAFLDFHRRCSDAAGEAIGPNLRWYLAQTLIAMSGEADLAQRLETHVEKALREAKRSTFWNAPNADVEDAAKDCARRLALGFDGLRTGLTRILGHARALSLTQTALKLTLPGIPDIYQGCEISCHALTDPDNRRAVDFDALAAGLADPSTLADDHDRDKLALTRRLLRLRRSEPALFLEGSYEPEPLAGGLAFRRRRGGLALRVEMRLDGTGIPDRDGDPVWPEAPGRPAPVRVTLVSGRGRADR